MRVAVVALSILLAIAIVFITLGLFGVAPLGHQLVVTSQSDGYHEHILIPSSGMIIVLQGKQVDMYSDDEHAQSLLSGDDGSITIYVK
jgi:hypothetical protein